MEQPIFIFGQARSGSTLVQRLINSYEDVIIYGEHLGLLTEIALSYHQFVKRSVSLSSFCERSTDRTSVAQHSLKRLKDPKDFSPNVNGLSLDHLQDAYRNFVRQLIHNIPAAPQVRWGFKEIRYSGTEDTVFEMLQELFPASRMIFLIRHPVDQIASKEGIGWWKKESIEAKTQSWISQTASYVRYVRAHPEQAILVRYEDLIRADTGQAQKMLEFVGYELGKKQEAILFEMGKVGASREKPAFSPEVRAHIVAQCVAAGHGNLYND